MGWQWSLCVTAWHHSMGWSTSHHTSSHPQSVCPTSPATYCLRMNQDQNEEGGGGSKPKLMGQVHQYLCGVEEVRAGRVTYRSSDNQRGGGTWWTWASVAEAEWASPVKQTKTWLIMQHNNKTINKNVNEKAAACLPNFNLIRRKVWW